MVSREAAVFCVVCMDIRCSIEKRVDGTFVYIVESFDQRLISGECAETGRTIPLVCIEGGVRRSLAGSLSFDYERNKQS